MFTSQTNIRNYSNGLLKRTKKIQKDSNVVSSSASGSQSKGVKSKIPYEFPKLNDLQAFLNEETNQFKKIKERTTQMINFDKTLIQKTIGSLKNYCEKKMMIDTNCKSEILLEVLFDKKPKKIPLKCIKM